MPSLIYINKNRQTQYKKTVISNIKSIWSDDYETKIKVYYLWTFYRIV